METTNRRCSLCAFVLSQKSSYYYRALNLLSCASFSFFLSSVVVVVVEEISATRSFSGSEY